MGEQDRAVRVRGTATAIVAIAVAVLTTVLSLSVASGITDPDQPASQTEFIDGGVLLIGSIITLLITLVASSMWPLAGLLAVVGACVSWFLGIHESLERYREAGLADDLEGMGQTYVLLYAVAGLVVVVVGALIGRWLRRR